jgi:hypothetical protein
MKQATLIAIGVLLASFFAASPAKAQCCFGPIPQAPDACGPGFYTQNYCGGWYGPGYALYPPFPPFNGMVPGPPPGAGGAGGYPGMMMGQARFPTHPFARGPRDFFMYEAK